MINTGITKLKYIGEYAYPDKIGNRAKTSSITPNSPIPRYLTMPFAFIRVQILYIQNNSIPFCLYSKRLQYLQTTKTNYVS